MIEELCPVGCVVRRAEDVHHHEVLDVVVLASLFQLQINIIMKSSAP